MSLTVTKRDFDAELRCNQLSYYTINGIEPIAQRPQHVAREFLTEAIPFIWIGRPADAALAAFKVEGDEERRMIYAMLQVSNIKAPQRIPSAYLTLSGRPVHLAGRPAPPAPLWDDVSYQPGECLLSRNTLHVPCVASELDSENVNRSADLYWLEAEAQAIEQRYPGSKIEHFKVHHFFMGRRTNGVYSNPFLSRYRAPAGGAAWARSWKSGDGKPQRLSSKYEKQSVPWNEIPSWAQFLNENPIQPEAGSPFDKVYSVCHFTRTPAWREQAFSTLYALTERMSLPSERRAKEWKYCRMPDRCPMHDLCRDGKSEGYLSSP